MTVREVAAVILLRDDGAALLQHRDSRPDVPHAGLWTPPGGHREGTESIEACARREFEEETGYRAAALAPLVDFVDDNAAGFPPMRLTVFWTRYDGQQPLFCREGQALEFVRRDDVSRHPIPDYLVRLWDLAWAAASAAAAGR